VKFINEGDDCDEEDDTVFEVALTKWLDGKLDDKMITKISWPPKSEQSIALKKELDARLSWPTYNVVVLKFYGMLFLIMCILCLLQINYKDTTFSFSRYTFECTECTKWIYFIFQL